MLRLQSGCLRRGDRLEALTVDDYPAWRGLAQRGVAVQARVYILVDEPLAERVDEHAVAGERRRQGDRRLNHGHPPGSGAHRDGHQDAAAIVAAVADLAVTHQDGGVVGEHFLVIDEAAGREDDAGSCAVPYRAAEPPRDQACHAPGLLGDQRAGTGVQMTPNAGGAHRGNELVHEQPSPEVRGRGPVPARCGTGDRSVRPGALAQPHQAVGRRGEPARRVVHGLVEGDPVLAEPVEMLDTPVAVEPQFLLVYVRAERRVQVGVHLVGTVVEPARLLHGGAATQVYLSAGLGGGPARPREPLEDEHVGAGGCRLKRGRRASAAEPDDQHVSLVVEPLNGRQRHRSDLTRSH